ncbi:MAG: DUF1501 domain-containing protein [Isosphaeraceae bacterium]|nr:DUF1501 domain-containing protein [Isosphaeraceae bacterium]
MDPRIEPADSIDTSWGSSRRECLGRLAGGFLGTALTALLSGDGFFDSPARAEDPTLEPKASHHPAKAKSIIILFMYGGPSQVDLFDPKPELQKRSGQAMPASVLDKGLQARNPGTLLGSKYAFRKHGKSGVEISELFPHLAKRADDLAVIRSLRADSFAHGSGLLQMNTGFVRQGFPSLGSWVAYGLGSENRNLPGYVVMLDQRGGPISGPPNWGNGFMPATYQGTPLRSSGDPILHLTPPADVSVEQQRNQIELLRSLSRDDRDGALGARIASYELAFRMQSSAPEAVDLSRETPATRSLYGLDDPRTEPFGRRLLIARRLVERGVRIVQVYSGGGHNDENWDAHGDVNRNHELHCGETDRPIAGLLADLESRGLLDETLIVWTGEFGRTPTGQNGKGRDHSPRGFSGWLAGGGVKGGQAFGRTDDFGYAAVEDVVHIHDLHATILHLLGIDHRLLTYFHSGRDYRLTDVSGRVVRELIA